MQSQQKHGKILTVRGGYLVCPSCEENKRVCPNCVVNRRLMKINPDTAARRVVVYCRSCKQEHIVDIEQGQCYESRSQ